MPNWCENDLYIRGELKEIRRLIKKVCTTVKHDDPDQKEIIVLDFNKVIPYPEKYTKMDEIANLWRKENPGNWKDAPRDGFNSGGYEWCIGNWGTKWTASGQRSELKTKPEEFAELFMAFDTAWTPPDPIFREIAKMFPKLSMEMNYFEAGVGFCGGLSTLDNEELDEDANGFVKVASWDNPKYRGSRGG